ncbi:MAG: hypothetical protein V1725_07650 [archaeon]
MNNTVRMLGYGTTIIGTLLMSGCVNTTYLQGKVVKEAGSVASVVESSGALFGNESVKFSNPTYLLQVQTSQGLYTIDVQNGCFGKTIEGLALAIEEGDSIRFPITIEPNTQYFSGDRIGKLKADLITVLK